MYERDWVLVVSESLDAPFRVRAGILEWGFAVEAVTSLAEAERRLARGRPAALFLDDELLHRHGSPAPQGLTYGRLGVPILLLSSDDAEGSYRRAAELGAMDVLGDASANPEEIRFRFTASLARHTILADRSDPEPQALPAAVRPAAATAGGTDGPPGRVLVVEDSEAIRLTSEKTFQSGGYEVTSCASAEEALEILERESFDVLFTDLGLHGMSGAELADAAKQRMPTLAVVLLSGRTRDAAQAGAAGASIDFVLFKPCGIDTILETAARAIRLARAA